MGSAVGQNEQLVRREGGETDLPLPTVQRTRGRNIDLLPVEGKREENQADDEGEDEVECEAAFEFEYLCESEDECEGESKGEGWPPLSSP